MPRTRTSPGARRRRGPAQPAVVSWSVSAIDVEPGGRRRGGRGRPGGSVPSEAELWAWMSMRTPSA